MSLLLYQLLILQDDVLLFWSCRPYPIAPLAHESSARVRALGAAADGINKSLTIMVLWAYWWKYMEQTAPRTQFDSIYVKKQHVLVEDLGYISPAMELTLIDQRLLLRI